MVFSMAAISVRDATSVSGPSMATSTSLTLVDSELLRIASTLFDWDPETRKSMPCSR